MSVCPLTAAMCRGVKPSFLALLMRSGCHFINSSTPLQNYAGDGYPPIESPTFHPVNACRLFPQHTSAMVKAVSWPFPPNFITKSNLFVYYTKSRYSVWLVGLSFHVRMYRPMFHSHKNVRTALSSYSQVVPRRQLFCPSPNLLAKSTKYLGRPSQFFLG